MLSPIRALVALVLASLALATSAAGQAAPRTGVSVRCAKTFTLPMFDRAARTVYHGTRTPPVGSYGHLWHLARCMRPPSSEAAARTAWARYLAAWHLRRHPPIAQPASALAACIIWHESGGNPQAVNGQYEGIGQWSPAAWALDGGLRFASTPLGASYSQQVMVLNGEGTAGMIRQQGVYDGCA